MLTLGGTGGAAAGAAATAAHDVHPRPTVHPPLHPPPACSYDLKGLREHLEQGGYMCVRPGWLPPLAAAAGWLPRHAAKAASRSSLLAVCHRSARLTCPAAFPTCPAEQVHPVP